MALISLHRISLGICDEQGDTQHKDLAKYMRLANLAAKDLFLYVIPHIEELALTSHILPIGNNFMVELPEDYIYYTKVGLISNGKIVLLGVDDTLIAGLETCDCGEEAENEINSICNGTIACEQYPFYNVWRTGQQVGEMYGLTGGRCFPGYFKEDKANNRLLLSSDLGGQELIIEYKADPTLNGISVVPSEAELAIREFIDHRANLHKAPTLADRAYGRYQIEYNKLKKMYSSMTESEWRSLISQSIHSSVKR